MTTESQLSAWQQSIIALSRTVIGISIVLALDWGRPVLIPVALATLLTFLLNPLVRRLQSWGLGRVSAVVVAVTLAGSGLGLIGVTGSRQVTNMLAQLPENTAKIVAKVKALKALISGPTAHRFEQMIEEISRELQLPAEIEPDSADATNSHPPIDRVVVESETFSWQTVSGHIGSAVEIMATLAFAMVLLVFFLMDREGLRDRVVMLAGKSRLTLTSKALEDATTRVSRYIEMVAIVNGGFGLLLTVGLFALGGSYALLWGCLAAVLRFIPYIGPWAGAIFPISMSLAMSEGWWQPLAVFGFVVVLELATNNIIEPLAFGRTTGVAPTALLISAAFWLFIWGPIGLILSAPFAVSLVVIGKNIPQLGFLYVLLGDKPALSDDVGFYQRLLVNDQQSAAEIIAEHLKTANSEELFDDLVIPAMKFAKRDVRRGHLAEEESEQILAVLRASLSDTDVHRRNVTDSAPLESDEPESKCLPSAPLVLLACSAEGDIDRVALELLRELVDPRQWKIEIVPPETLTSELAAHVTNDPPAAICVSALPPGGIPQVRYLCKKLRSADGDVPIVVGRWGLQSLSSTDRDRLMEVGVNAVTLSLAETRKWLSSRYAVQSQPTSDPSSAIRGRIHVPTTGGWTGERGSSR